MASASYQPHTRFCSRFLETAIEPHMDPMWELAIAAPKSLWISAPSTLRLLGTKEAYNAHISPIRRSSIGRHSPPEVYMTAHGLEQVKRPAQISQKLCMKQYVQAIRQPYLRPLVEQPHTNSTWSRVDLAFPWYGPVSRNPYALIIIPFQSTYKTAAHTSDLNQDTGQCQTPVQNPFR